MYLNPSKSGLETLSCLMADRASSAQLAKAWYLLELSTPLILKGTAGNVTEYW